MVLMSHEVLFSSLPRNSGVDEGVNALLIQDAEQKGGLIHPVNDETEQSVLFE